MTKCIFPTKPMTTTLANQPIDRQRCESLVSMLRSELERPPSEAVEPVRPLVAYTVLFAEEPHESIQRRVHGLYSKRSRFAATAPEHGHVYVFRDARDEEYVVKIGSSTRVRRRMAEWRAALHAKSDELSLLFSFQCDHVRLAETLIHELLYCQWQPKRVNLYSGDRALEYFRVVDWQALRYLCDAVTRHVTWQTGRQNRRMLGYSQV